MSLQFVLGNSGCGKSQYIYKKIVDEAREDIRKNYLVIVPEQFTLQTQRKLVELSANKAIMNVDVLSFKRLAYRVFDELGIKSLDVLEETGKNLVLRKLASELEDQLTVLKGNMSKMGYISEVKSLLSEMTQYNITPESLSEILGREGIPSQLKAKLGDVLIMYKSFNDFMKDKYITAEEILSVLIKVAGESAMLRDSVIVFDEFTGFTPIQNQLFRELLDISRKIYVVHTIDSGEDFYHSSGIHELFDMPKKSIRTLIDMVNPGQELEETIILGDKVNYRFNNRSNELAFLEKHIFRPRKVTYNEKCRDICMASCKNPREELLFAAREINRLVQEKGYRYRDIAVVTGDVDTYGNYIESIFNTYKIPYYLDKTSEILFHPFIEFIRAMLEVIDSNFSYESVFRFLRCGFCDIDTSDIDELENYIIATGIRGINGWKKKWVRRYKGSGELDLDRLNEIREQIVEIFKDMIEVFSDKDATVSQMIGAMYQCITGLDIENKLCSLEDYYQEEGSQTKAKEYHQIYQIVMGILDKYYELLGGERMSLQDFIEVLDAGFDAAEVATVPPGYDTVTIGDIERTRLNEIRILFFIGVNEGIVPKVSANNGIISQYEREKLESLDIQLAPGAREQTFMQRYYLYISMTKPSDGLYLLYSRTDSQGKAAQPSYLIGEINRLYPELVREDIVDLDKTADLSTRDAAWNYLVRGEKEGIWYQIAAYFAEKSDDEFEKIMEAMYHVRSHEPISRQAALAIYGDKLVGSVTRLENYALCAYAHFLIYGLGIRERTENSFDNIDMGNVYHDALKNYGYKIKNSQYTWQNIPQEQHREFAENAFQEALLNCHSLDENTSASDMHQTRVMGELFNEVIDTISRQVKAGDIVPEQFEHTFSGQTNPDELVFRLEDGRSIELLGRVDRIDTCSLDGKLCVKVVDYKLSPKNLELDKLYKGSQLQLVVYLNAISKEQQRLHKSMLVVPAGILYQHIEYQTLKEEDFAGGKSPEDVLLSKLRPNGLVNSESDIYRTMDRNLEEGMASDYIPISLKKDGSPTSYSKTASTDEFRVMEEFAGNKIRELGNQIYSGNIDLNPDNCQYCKFASVCGVKSGLVETKTRKNEKLSREEIMDKMITANALARAKEV